MFCAPVLPKLGQQRQFSPGCGAALVFRDSRVFFSIRCAPLPMHTVPAFLDASIQAPPSFWNSILTLKPVRNEGRNCLTCVAAGTRA